MFVKTYVVVMKASKNSIYFAKRLKKLSMYLLLVQITSKTAIIVVIAVPCFRFLIVFCNKQTNPALNHKKVDIFFLR